MNSKANESLIKVTATMNNHAYVSLLRLPVLLLSLRFLNRIHQRPPHRTTQRPLLPPLPFARYDISHRIPHICDLCGNLVDRT